MFHRILGRQADYTSQVSALQLSYSLPSPAFCVTNSITGSRCCRSSSGFYTAAIVSAVPLSCRWCWNDVVWRPEHRFPLIQCGQTSYYILFITQYDRAARNVCPHIRVPNALGIPYAWRHKNINSEARYSSFECRIRSRDPGHAHLGDILWSGRSRGVCDVCRCLCQIWSIYLYSLQSYKGGPKIWKLGHVTRATPTYGSFYNPYAGRVHPLCTKCEADSSIRSKVIRGSPNFEIRSRDLGHAHLGVFLSSESSRGTPCLCQI